jgi:DNA-directed RNA polymerase I, II, and III subunit RPABC1
MDITVRDYYLIRKNVIEMLYDRSEQQLNRCQFERGSLDLYNMIPYEAIEEIYNNAIISKSPYQQLNFNFENEYQKIAIIFLQDTKGLNTNIEKFRNIYNLKKNEILIIVICTKEKPNEQQTRTSSKYDEVFWYKQLTFNITKHSLVPKHELLLPNIKNELKEIYFLNRINQLPTLLERDPVAKWYGMKPGDICRITRENPNIGTSIIYRLVVESY